MRRISDRLKFPDCTGYVAEINVLLVNTRIADTTSILV
jgi:hypothetical protein